MHASPSNPIPKRTWTCDVTAYFRRCNQNHDPKAERPSLVVKSDRIGKRSKSINFVGPRVQLRPQTKFLLAVAAVEPQANRLRSRPSKHNWPPLPVQMINYKTNKIFRRKTGIKCKQRLKFINQTTLLVCPESPISSAVPLEWAAVTPQPYHSYRRPAPRL